MNETNELEALGAIWRTEVPDVPADLRHRARVESVRMRIYVAIEVLISIAFLSGSVWLAITLPEPEFIVLAIGVCIITLGALAYSFINRAGTWEAATQDARGYLALSLRRARARLAAIRFGFYLLAIEVALLAAWHLWYWSERPAPPLDARMLVLCLPVVFLVVLLTLRARRRRELARLESLEGELFG